MLAAVVCETGVVSAFVVALAPPQPITAKPSPAITGSASIAARARPPRSIAHIEPDSNKDSPLWHWGLLGFSPADSATWGGEMQGSGKRSLSSQARHGGESKQAWHTLTLIVVLLLALGANACGSTRQRSGGAQVSSRLPVNGALLGDGDHDNPADIDGDEYEDGDPDSDASLAPKSYHDSDDDAITGFGSPANTADSDAIAAQVKRYYSALTAGLGRKACALMLPGLANTLAESYGGPGGPGYLHGANSCAAVVALAAAHLRRELAGVVQVTGVRVDGAQAYALVGSTTMPAGYIQVRREAGIWKISALMDLRLP